MSKLVGRKVKLVLSSFDVTGNPYMSDRYEVGDVITIKTALPESEDNRWPVIVTGDNGQDWFCSSQLRYLNNKEVKL